MATSPSPAVELDTRTQEILLAASNHNLAALKPFLRVPGAAQVQDPETGWTPLHAAIGACERSEPGEEAEDDEFDMVKAKETVRELLMSGAIWNDLDAKNETPGCLAWRIGAKELYELVVEAGVRAELLMGLMGGYEMLEDEEDEEEDDVVEVGGKGEVVEVEGKNDATPSTVDESTAITSKLDVNSADYLASNLTFTSAALLDDDANGVMMAWETDIMQKTAALLAPRPGLRILNIGLGMGIIDGIFAATQPAKHHIIEAHPDVLKGLSDEKHAFGPTWQSKEGSEILHGKWQDVVPDLLARGEVYDAIYFDTFGEDYSQLKLFFTEYVVGLLDPEGLFGFFNGLGADRRVCYDVYTRVVEMDLCDAGLEVEWEDVPVEAGEEGKGDWEGVRRRYWTLETYRLPTCRFLG